MRTVVVAVAITVRLVVALFLVVGPATDEIDELAGWDAERFQEIAERDGPAWIDHPVEYPPGSVVVFDRLAGADVVETHRRLVVLSLVLDLGVALAMARRLGRPSATAYLWLGLPLIPFGYQRLDTLVTTIAVVAALALLGRAGSVGAETSKGPGAAGMRAGVTADVVVAAAIAAGTMIKVWPVLLIVGAVAIGRWRAAITAGVLTGAAGLAWLAVIGDGFGPVDQVLSLRGATGWHVESLPGALVALVGSDRAELELNAYRIGTLRPGLVTAGRALAVVTMGLLAVGGLRRTRARTPARGGDGGDTAKRVEARGEDRRVFALATLGSVAALVVTAPLLSPQFLVWLVPFAAMAWPPENPRADPIHVRLALLAAATAAMLTGVALHGFGPDGLSGLVPAALLTVRNLALVAVAGTCLLALWSSGRSDDQLSS